MRGVLSAAGRSFLRAFVASVLVFAPGILAAPNLNEAYALGVAALVASFSAGLKALQVFVPALTIPAGAYTELVNSFVRAALAAFFTSLVGVLDAPNLDFGKAVVVGLVTGALTAGIRAIQGVFTPGDEPAGDRGFSTVEDDRDLHYARAATNKEPVGLGV